MRRRPSWPDILVIGEAERYGCDCGEGKWDAAAAVREAGSPAYTPAPLHAAGAVGTVRARLLRQLTREGVNVAALILDAVEGKDPVTGKVIRTPARLLDTKGLDSNGDDTSFRLRLTAIVSPYLAAAGAFGAVLTGIAAIVRAWRHGD